MKNLKEKMLALAMLALGTILVSPEMARGQDVDTAAVDSSAERLGLWARATRSSGLVLTTGKTYNRVEGLPVYLGPMVRDSSGRVAFNLSAMGIIRSADAFHWDNENLGHRVLAEMRAGRERGYGLAVSSYDIVAPVEAWRLPDPDAGLAAFFGHRDFRDYFNRHGAKLTGTFNMSARSSVSLDWSDERWASVRARKVFSVFGNGEEWRANPAVDNGRFHTAVARVNIDTRNDETNPSTGWLINGEYENGTGTVSAPGLTSPLARSAFDPEVTYGRALLDLRRYNRLSPTTWINARLVLGGWLHGDELPLQRRFSVGGLGTVPGVDFRKFDPGIVDVSQCSDAGQPPAGNPAQCERVALAQLEYRSELHSSLLDFLNARPIRLRGVGFTVRPTAVAFVDAGRGWLVGQPSGTLVYSSRSFPRFGTFRTDVGLGLDLGIIGVYVAKSVSSPKDPANVFLRVHRLF